VAIAALVAREFPKLRVVMWTCPIILLTTPPSGSILVAAFRRGGEVILGALVGWVFHWAAEIIVDTLAATGQNLHHRRTVRYARPRAAKFDPSQDEGGVR
jgi:hypothetical protein